MLGKEEKRWAGKGVTYTHYSPASSHDTPTFDKGPDFFAKRSIPKKRTPNDIFTNGSAVLMINQ